KSFTSGIASADRAGSHARSHGTIGNLPRYQQVLRLALTKEGPNVFSRPFRVSFPSRLDRPFGGGLRNEQTSGECGRRPLGPGVARRECPSPGARHRVGEYQRDLHETPLLSQGVLEKFLGLQARGEQQGSGQEASPPR